MLPCATPILPFGKANELADFSRLTFADLVSRRAISCDIMPRTNWRETSTMRAVSNGFKDRLGNARLTKGSLHGAKYFVEFRQDRHLICQAV